MADGNVALIEEDAAPVVVNDDRASYGELTFAQRVALDPSIDVERLEKIIDMERNSERYAAEKAFARAMSQMQPKLPAVDKTGENLHLKSKYAKLEDIQSAVRPLLSEHGFAVRWTSETIDGKICVTCIITHKDGHSERDTLPLPVLTQNGTNALQQHGVTMTYGKRYTLCNVLGIQLGGEDSDGAPQLSGETLTEFQVTGLRDMLKKLDREEEGFLSFMSKRGVIVASALDDVPAESFNALQATLAGFAKKQGAENAE